MNDFWIPRRNETSGEYAEKQFGNILKYGGEWFGIIPVDGGQAVYWLRGGLDFGICTETALGKPMLAAYLKEQCITKLNVLRSAPAKDTTGSRMESIATHWKRMLEISGAENEYIEKIYAEPTPEEVKALKVMAAVSAVPDTNAAFIEDADEIADSILNLSTDMADTGKAPVVGNKGYSLHSVLKYFTAYVEPLGTAGGLQILEFSRLDGVLEMIGVGGYGMVSIKLNQTGLPDFRPIAVTNKEWKPVLGLFNSIESIDVTAEQVLVVQGIISGARYTRELPSLSDREAELLDSLRQGTKNISKCELSPLAIYKLDDLIKFLALLRHKSTVTFTESFAYSSSPACYTVIELDADAGFCLSRSMAGLITGMLKFGTVTAEQYLGRSGCFKFSAASSNLSIAAILLGHRPPDDIETVEAFIKTRFLSEISLRRAAFSDFINIDARKQDAVRNWFTLRGDTALVSGADDGLVLRVENASEDNPSRFGIINATSSFIAGSASEEIKFEFNLRQPVLRVSEPNGIRHYARIDYPREEAVTG